MVFKIMKASASFYAVDYNEKKQERGQAQNVYFQNFGYLQAKGGAIQTASPFFAVDYNENKREGGQAETIHHQNFGGLPDSQAVTKAELKKYMEDYSARNSRIKNPQFHAVLSCKGQEYSFEQLKDHSLELMKRLGYGNNPMLIYEHRDTKNNHIHIVTSRVGPDGRKINHDLEGKRANKILNEILKIDSKQNYQQALNKSLSYNISTIAQFKLLMENQGYSVKETEDKINFYRHGTGQGSIEVNQLKEKIANCLLDTKRVSQIKAFIHKYKTTHDPVLVRDKNPNIHTSTKPTFHSELTKYLRDNLGIQFVFHADKEKKPYGYTIIDHKEKAVYKGGEIMKMEQLCRPVTQDEKESQTSHYQGKPNQNENSNDPLQSNENSFFKSQQKNEEITINTGVSTIIDSTLQEVESEANSIANKKKKKAQRRM